MKYDKVTMQMENTKSNVLSAMMFGLIPCLTAPKIAVGNVSTPDPLTKLVMIKSSSEMMNASMNPAAIIVNQVSEPVLRPFRRIIPSFSGLDLSPILALLALNLVLRLVVHPVMDAGRRLFF